MLVLSAISANLIAFGATLRPIRKDNTKKILPHQSATEDSSIANSRSNIVKILRDLICNVPSAPKGNMAGRHTEDLQSLLWQACPL